MSQKAYELIIQILKLEQLKRLCSEIPPTTPWLLILEIYIRSQVKRKQSQSYKFKKNSEVVYKMYKYEMDPTRTVGATEQTQDAGRMDGQTSLENLISAAMKQAAPHTCFFFLVFFI